MALQRINWLQINTENIPSGSTVTLGSSEHPFEHIYTKDLTASGDLNVTGSTVLSDVTGDTFVKYGGTSDQYLMADGTVTTTGETQLHYDNRYVNVTGDTINGSLTIQDGDLDVTGGTLYINGVEITSGSSGTSGTSGTSGSSGSFGTSGTSGSAGTSGTSGSSGSSGTSGTSGLSGDKYYSSSSTTTIISTGSKAFTIETGLSYSRGQSLVIAYDSINYMEGIVDSYDTNTGVLLVTIFNDYGGGTYSQWSVNLAGSSGSSGTSGTSGSSGSAGTSGTSGSSGSSGTSGTSGSSGTRGTSGTSGTSGSSGSSGTSGTSGTSGSAGTSGTSGTSGSAGTSGTSGSSGSSGTSGTSGTSGSAGTSGTSGTSGSAGTSGTSGSSGSSGTSGTSGTSGSAGTSGTSGTSGSAGTSGTSGTSGSVKEITYEGLTDLIDANLLSVGNKYLITDYQTVHTIPNTTDTNTGEVEPLLVTAISVNELAPEAYSALFPDDVIYYSPTNDPVMVEGCTKGYIYRRVDTKQNNDIPFDFRQVKFRRWQISQPTWDGVTTYAKGIVVKSTIDNTLWFSLVDNNLNNATSDTTYWRQFEWYNLSYVSPYNGQWNITWGSFQSILTCTALYQDYKMWAVPTDYDSAYSNKLEAPNGDLISNSNTVIFGTNFYSNSIGANFYSNSIGAGFYSNSIGADFNSNSIGADFNSNSIGANFKYNSIGTYFNNNSIGAYFNNNTIGAYFGNNSIGANFDSNSIGAYFNNNIIGANFSNNTIGVYFINNTIGASSINNSIVSNFGNNSIGANFSNNTIGVNFDSNSIGADFNSNSIVSNFNYNSIGANFNNNTIGAYFKNNSVLSNLQNIDLTAVAELYDKEYPHEVIPAASGRVIRWYDSTGVQQSTFIA